MPFATAGAATILLSALAGAVDGPKWAQVDPATREWFKNLHSPSGFPCCDFADGTRLDDPQYWENEDGSYEVMINGRDLHVPKDKVVTATNRIGYAVFWGRADHEQVYCFLPGARG